MNAITFLAIRLLPILFGAILITAPAHAASVKVEILFMNHGPMQPVIKQIKDVLRQFPDAVQVFWHDVETADGADFMKRMGIKGHIPLMIFVDGSTTQEVGGKSINFTGFPNGAGPFMFQGAWGMQDLEAVLQSKTGKR
ncbi:MAG: hypothetical protein AAGU21_08590 [Solidesulfovibrio sp.]|uniref:hypothetical protein n=1 Tax=Solidesulfovibrio sp. TaxID=2910990 RepID=UPI00315862A0